MENLQLISLLCEQLKSLDEESRKKAISWVITGFPVTTPAQATKCLENRGWKRDETFPHSKTSIYQKGSYTLAIPSQDAADFLKGLMCIMPMFAVAEETDAILLYDEMCRLPTERFTIDKSEI